MVPGDTNIRCIGDERSLRSTRGRRQAGEACEAKYSVLSTLEYSESCKIKTEKCALDLTKTSF